jgi:hypothetical protein
MKLDLEALKRQAEAYSGLPEKECRALINELAETRRERDEERATLVAALASAPQSLANARAAMAEDVIAWLISFDADDTGHVALLLDESVAGLRALAALTKVTTR